MCASSPSRAFLQLIDKVTLHCEDTVLSVVTYMHKDKHHCNGKSDYVDIIKEQNPEYGACLRVRPKGERSLIKSSGAFCALGQRY